MFTGLVQAKGRVEAMEASEAGARLSIDAGGWEHASARGDSISVSGVCLTLVAREGGVLSFDVVGETLAVTTLGSLCAGDAVNLEASLCAGGSLGGHIVQGHVDAVGEVREVAGDGRDRRLTIAVDADLMQYIVPKGSVCVDGVSLTVAGVAEDSFEVALIPETLEATTLGGVSRGARCNIETDILSRTVVHWLRRWGPGGGGSAPV